MTALTREQVEAWAKLAEQATPGPWEVYECPGCEIGHGDPHQDIFKPMAEGANLSIADVYGDSEDARNRAAFICAARTAVPQLLDQIAAKDAEVERLRHLESIIDDGDPIDHETRVDILHDAMHALAMSPTLCADNEELRVQLAALRKVAEVASWPVVYEFLRDSDWTRELEDDESKTHAAVLAFIRTLAEKEKPDAPAVE